MIDDYGKDTAPAEALATSGRKATVKALILCIVAVALLLAAYLTPLRRYAKDLSEWITQIRAMGVIAPILFTAATAILVAVCVPRLTFCVIGGTAFGFFLGLLCSQIGSLLGSYATFLFARWAGRDFVMRHRPKLGKFGMLLDTRSAAAVVLARQLPITAGVINMALGISPVRHSRFLIGTFIGTLPEAIVFTMIGKGLRQHGDPGHGMVYISGAVALVLVIWMVNSTRRRRRNGISDS